MVGATAQGLSPHGLYAVLAWGEGKRGAQPFSVGLPTIHSYQGCIEEEGTRLTPLRTPQKSGFPYIAHSDLV